MSRWRPLPEKSTALITPEGHARLKRELDDLWRVKRPEVVKALAAAAAEGDRSENAEYTYRKKQLGEMDRRIRYLSKRLEVLRVVDRPPAHREAVFFGAVVEVENASTGEVSRYRIVGPDETDARQGWISIDSPLARAMLKKQYDDEFEAQLPAGAALFIIVSVDYPLSCQDNGNGGIEDGR
ncbi:MAG: transcription elongation factor GreB [Xanthomonadaceae bacterium]|jgi:transcription elongation factor GreB|nr:transcription elongation factor GreB [Xanthomonadaceae bacterium]